jgi:hypothetical protein
MITLRPRATIHHTDGGWFSAYWHFSFDDYNDPENTWFGRPACLQRRHACSIESPPDTDGHGQWGRSPIVAQNT